MTCVDCGMWASVYWPAAYTWLCLGCWFARRRHADQISEARAASVRLLDVPVKEKGQPVAGPKVRSTPDYHGKTWPELVAERIR